MNINVNYEYMNNNKPSYYLGVQFFNVHSLSLWPPPFHSPSKSNYIYPTNNRKNLNYKKKHIIRLLNTVLNFGKKIII